MRKVIVTALLAVVIAGCQREKPPWSHVVYNVRGYYIHFEAAAATQSFSDDSVGAEVKDIRISVIGERHHLKIDGGKLILNGQPRGTANPGEKIEVTAAGQLQVNGQPRGE